MSHQHEQGEWRRHGFQQRFPGGYAEFNVPELYGQMGPFGYARPGYGPPPGAVMVEPPYPPSPGPRPGFNPQLQYEAPQQPRPAAPRHTYTPYRPNDYQNIYGSQPGHQFAGGAYTAVQAPDQQTLGNSVRAVLQVAHQYGLSGKATVAAVASMLAESKGNPRAVGDAGTSFGLFELHRGGELTDAHLTPLQAFDPVTNASVALRYFKSSQSIGDPGWIAAAAQRPQNRSEYAAKIDSLLGTAEQLIRMYGGGAPAQYIPPQTFAAPHPSYHREPVQPRMQYMPAQTFTPPNPTYYYEPPQTRLQYMPVQPGYMPAQPGYMPAQPGYMPAQPGAQYSPLWRSSQMNYAEDDQYAPLLGSAARLILRGY